MMRALLVLSAGVILVATGVAQTPYRGRADLVSIYATVTGPDGRLVPDLTKGDFEVRDNGKVQTLSYFSNDLQPITIIVMLDRSGSMEDNFALVADAAEQFVKKLLPDDRARIGNFSRQIVITPADFTSDQNTLLEILRRDLQNVGPSPVWTAIDRSITALLKQEGRRVVLVFTDGHDDPRLGQVRTDFKDVVRRAEIDEIMIYAIGLADTEDASSSWMLHNQRQIQFGTRHRNAKVIKPDPGLKRLADQSGGGYFELTWGHDLGATFSRVADELHRQYWLAFAPARLDGSIHKLEIKAKRPGLTVRGRKSYVAEAR
jgi:Ca-activated chloride channel family protein